MQLQITKRKRLYIKTRKKGYSTFIVPLKNKVAGKKFLASVLIPTNFILGSAYDIIGDDEFDGDERNLGIVIGAAQVMIPNNYSVKMTPISEENSKPMILTFSKGQEMLEIK